MKKAEEGTKILNKFFSLKMTQKQYDKIKACAVREGIPLSALFAKVGVDYAERDVDITKHVVASMSRLHSDLKKLSDAQVLSYNLLYSYIYMFLFVAAKECSYEFATEEYTSDEQLLAKGLAQKGKADRVMELFTRKFLSDDAVKRCILANLASLQDSVDSGSDG